MRASSQPPPPLDAAGGRPVAIISGSSGIARRVTAQYRALLASEKLVVIEERPDFVVVLKRFIRRRLKKHGLFSVLDAIVGRLWQGFSHRFMTLAKEEAVLLKPALVVASVNDPAIATHLDAVDARLVILNLCSVVSAEQLHAIGRPMINVHPGINPRYRGAGNVWALSEGRMDLVGATVHAVDAGVDTGSVLGYVRIDPVARALGVEDTFVVAQAAGAALAAALIRGEAPPPIPPEFQELESQFYGYPGLTTWLRAWYRLRLARRASLARPATLPPGAIPRE